MALITSIPGADFSGSGLPKFERLVSGFPVTNLRGLYLFEDGANGSTITTAVDSSGLGNHAALASGGAGGTKSAEGLVGTNSANPPVFSAPGISLGQAFTAVMVAKTDMPADVPGTGFPWWWRPSSDIGAGLGDSQLGGEKIDMNRSGTGPLNVGWFQAATWASSGGSRISMVHASEAKTSWFAAAFSFSPSANRYRMAFAGMTLEEVDATLGAASAAKTGSHLFGVGRWGASTNEHPGKMALFAIYSGAKSLTDMAALVTAAKARAALRGISAT